MWMLAQNHSSPGPRPPRRIEGSTGGHHRDLRDNNQVAAGVKSDSSYAPRTPNKARRD